MYVRYDTTGITYFTTGSTNNTAVTCKFCTKYEYDSHLCKHIIRSNLLIISHCINTFNSSNFLMFNEFMSNSILFQVVEKYFAGFIEILISTARPL